MNEFVKYILTYQKKLEILKKDKNFSLAESIIENAIIEKKQVFIFGNGGSASIASHFANDLIKNFNCKCFINPEMSLMTCLSNDFGYKHVMKKTIENYYNQGDLVIIISSSGNSKNVIEATNFCISKKLNLMTLTGMSKNNKIKQLNSNGVNFWINSNKYNIIENMHQIILLTIFDVLNEKLKK